MFQYWNYFLILHVFCYDFTLTKATEGNHDVSDTYVHKNIGKFDKVMHHLIQDHQTVDGMEGNGKIGEMHVPESHHAGNRKGKMDNMPSQMYNSRIYDMPSNEVDGLQPNKFYKNDRNNAYGMKNYAHSVYNNMDHDYYKYSPDYYKHKRYQDKNYSYDYKHAPDYQNYKYYSYDYKYTPDYQNYKYYDKNYSYDYKYSPEYAKDNVYDYKYAPDYQSYKYYDKNYSYDYKHAPDYQNYKYNKDYSYNYKYAPGYAKAYDYDKYDKSGNIYKNYDKKHVYKQGKYYLPWSNAVRHCNPYSQYSGPYSNECYYREDPYYYDYENDYDKYMFHPYYYDDENEYDRWMRMHYPNYYRPEVTDGDSANYYKKNPYENEKHRDEKYKQPSYKYNPYDARNSGSEDYSQEYDALYDLIAGSANKQFMDMTKLKAGFKEISATIDKKIADVSRNQVARTFADLCANEFMNKCVMATALTVLQTCRKYNCPVGLKTNVLLRARDYCHEAFTCQTLNKCSKDQRSFSNEDAQLDFTRLGTSSNHHIKEVKADKIFVDQIKSLLPQRINLNNIDKARETFAKSCVNDLQASCYNACRRNLEHVCDKMKCSDRIESHYKLECASQCSRNKLIRRSRRYSDGSDINSDE